MWPRSYERGNIDGDRVNSSTRIREAARTISKTIAREAEGRGVAVNQHPEHEPASVLAPLRFLLDDPGLMQDHDACSQYLWPTFSHTLIVFRGLR